MHGKRIKAREKISGAVALMAETLRYQKPVTCPAEPSWMLPIPRYGISIQCHEHENCLSIIETYRMSVSVAYPECTVWRFQKDEVPYFIIYSEFSQLSIQLSRGETECEAWKNALKSVTIERGAENHE